METNELNASLRDLHEIIHLIQDISLKILNLTDEKSIFKTLIKEFSKSKKYNISVFLLNDEGKKLELTGTSMTSERINASLKIAGLKPHDNHVFSLSRSKHFSKVIKENETIKAEFSKVIKDFFPKKIATILTKALGCEGRTEILTPLKKGGKTGGALVIDSPELDECIIPSVKNLSQHLSTALEMAEKHAERVKMDEKLRRSEQEKGLILNSMVELVAYQDLKHRILWVNRVACESVGLTPEQIVGRYCYDVWGQKDKVCVGCPVEKAIRTGQPQENEMFSHDGRAWLIQGSPIRDENGKITGAIETTLEITERKLMEEELKKSRNHIHKLFNTIVDPIVIIDAKGKILEATTRVEEVSGFKKEDVIGKNLLESNLLTMESKQIVLRNIEKRLKGMEISPYEIEVIAKDGRNIPVEVNASRIEYNNEPAIIAVFRDLTERKNMEDKLRTTKEKYDAMLQSIGDHISLMDEDLNIIWANKVAKEKFGDDIIGKKCYRVYHNRSKPCEPYPCLTLKAFQDGKVHEHETKVIDKDGKPIHFHCVANVALRDKDGKPTAVIEISRDISDRKMMEKSLIDERNMLHLLMDNSPDSIYFKDAKSRFMRINKAKAQRMGLSDPEEAVGKLDKEFYSSDFTQEILDDEKQLFSTGQPLIGKVEKVVYRDGRSRWVSVTKVPIKDEEGHVKGLIGITRNIGEIMNMEEKLRESEARYRRLIDNMFEGVFQTTPDGRFITVNKSLVKMLGYDSEDELLKVNVKDLYIDSEDRNVFLKRIAMRGELKATELTLRRKDGKVIVVLENSHVVKDENGEILYYEGSLTDITDRKRMQRQLEDSEQYYRSVFETTGTATVILEDDMSISSVNKEFENLSGYLREEAQGKMSMVRFILKDDLDQVRDYHERRRLDPGFAPQRYQYRFIDRLGDVKNVIASVTLIPNTNKRIVSLLDVTELEKIKETMKIKDAVLASSINRAKDMEMKERFISVATHELRTPLISIKGYVDYILSGKLGEVPERVESSMTIVKRNTDRLLNLTNDLLDVRRLESGRLELNIEELDFQDVISHSVKEIQPFIDEINHAFKVSIPKQSLLMRGDRIRLSQVLMNLLNNAVKYTPKKGVISLNVEDKGDEVEVQVSDTGIGIRKEDLDRVFNLFANIKKPGYFKGTGIGLSVTRGLVEAHGGKIWVESEGEGKGSTFIFTIPKKRGDVD